MKPNLRRYLISISVGLLIACVVMLVEMNNEYDYRVVEDYTSWMLIILNDSFFLSGMCLIGAGLLVLVSNIGAFSIFGYAFSLFFGKRKRDVSDRKYKDFYEYKQAKSEEKTSCAYLLLVGLAFIAVAMILLIWIKF